MVDYDVVIVGAGISGICAGYYLKQMCPKKTFRILERREGLGGTWDLFEYPGIRSDSDMYTFGYSFRPWNGSKTIAPKEQIMKYLWDTAHETRVAEHVQFGVDVREARFRTSQKRWTLQTSAGEFTASFLLFCTGYYKYEEGYTPTFEGIDAFRGVIVHPQHWTGPDYRGKRVVVIGSGATAATLVPALAEGGASKVTMLQRSPGYYINMPSDASEKWWMIPSLLGPEIDHTIKRWAHIVQGTLFYWFCTTFPNAARKELKRRVRAQTPRDFDVETHFDPAYDPWEQRLCLVPDGDFFGAVRSGVVEVVTDHVDTFVESGVRTQSGRVLEADVVVTATGLNLQTNFPMSTTRVFVDGREYDAPSAYMYRGVMLSDVPNFAFFFGYANASWTLRAELTAVFVCRLLNRMDLVGALTCVPRMKQGDEDGDERQFFELTSGYLARARDRLPKQGARDPWLLHQNFFKDCIGMQFGSMEDGVLEFDDSARRSRL